MDFPIWSTLALGFVLGLRHALDADHLAAVSTFASEEKSLLRSSMIGVSWGMGHTAALLVFGLAVAAFRLALTPRLAQVLEFGVGCMLMALGLELWKGYVHRTNLDGTALSDVVPRVVGRLMKLVPTPPPAPSAAPVSGTAPPHVSLLAMVGLGAAILASLSAAAAAITLAVQDGTSGIGFGPREVEELRIAAFATGAAAACLGIIGGVLGVVSSSHLREGTDRLKGRGAAQAAVFLSILSLAVALGHVRPRLWEMRSKVQAARSTADRFVKALCEERFDDAWEMLSDDLRSRVSREDLRKAADGEVRRELRSWEPLNARQAVLSQDGASCRVEGPYSGGYRSAALGLKGSDSWRVHDLREFVAPVAR